MLPLPALPASSTLLGASCCAGLLRNTAVGQALSPQMLSFSLCLTLSNLGLMPATSPVYDLVARRLLPLSAALGLLAGARLEGSTGTSRLANRNTAAAASGDEEEEPRAINPRNPGTTTTGNTNQRLSCITDQQALQ